MKIDDIHKSNLSNEEKAKQAILLYEKTVKWFNEQTIEVQEEYLARLNYTFDMCNIIGSSLSLQELTTLWDSLD